MKRNNGIRNNEIRITRGIKTEAEGAKERQTVSEKSKKGKDRMTGVKRRKKRKCVSE